MDRNQPRRHILEQSKTFHISWNLHKGICKAYRAITSIHCMVFCSSKDRRKIILQLHNHVIWTCLGFLIARRKHKLKIKFWQIANMLPIDIYLPLERCYIMLALFQGRNYMSGCVFLALFVRLSLLSLHGQHTWTNSLRPDF